jgi:hypothetical protein
MIYIEFDKSVQHALIRLRQHLLIFFWQVLTKFGKTILVTSLVLQIIIGLQGAEHCSRNGQVQLELPGPEDFLLLVQGVQRADGEGLQRDSTRQVPLGHRND